MKQELPAGVIITTYKKDYASLSYQIAVDGPIAFTSFALCCSPFWE